MARRDSDGFTALTADDVTDAALLTKRFDMFVAEAREAFAASKDTAKSMAILGTEIMPLLQEIRQELRETRQEVRAVTVRVAYLESAKVAHAEEITGLHKRIAVVEQTVSKAASVVARKSLKK